MSQLQHKNQNQNFISSFLFQLIKKPRWHFRFSNYVNIVNVLVSNKSFSSYLYDDYRIKPSQVILPKTSK